MRPTNWFVNILRWLAVVPAAAIVYLLTNWFVLIMIQSQGERSLLGFIPIHYFIEVIRAIVAPYVAVRAGAYVAGVGKLAAAAVVGMLFVILNTLMVLGLLLLTDDPSNFTLPLWFMWALVVITLISAGVGVHSEYEVVRMEAHDRTRAEAIDEMRPYYKSGIGLTHQDFEGRVEEDDLDFESATFEDDETIPFGKSSNPQ